MTTIYLIDIYRDGSQWTGFDREENLEDAKALVLRKFPQAEEVTAADGYRREDAAEKSANGEAECVARFEIDSTDYAEIFEIAE